MPRLLADEIRNRTNTKRRRLHKVNRCQPVSAIDVVLRKQAGDEFIQADEEALLQCQAEIKILHMLTPDLAPIGRVASRMV